MDIDGAYCTTIMTSLQLRLIEAECGTSKPLLDLFQRFREHVVRVATTHLLPDSVAVTTKHGFIEVINSATGEFYLYLTHLNHIPLHTTIRTFALAPTFDDGVPLGTQIVYSLAYSNELLLGEFGSGRVRVLQTCRSRPSTAFCDADYMVCGEGNGQVTVWRVAAGGEGLSTEGGSKDSGSPTLLWQLPVFEDTVSTLCVHRGLLLCCAADLSCRVVDIATGVGRARLPHGPTAVVAMLPLVEPLVHRVVVVACAVSQMSVYTELPMTAAAAVSKDGWLSTGRVALDTEVQCATCCGPYLATGTASGVVLLYRCNAATGVIEEQVRFDVGYGVVGIQLYASHSLLVVTSAGDVWRWPVEELLAVEVMEGEVETPQPSALYPVPTGSDTATENVAAFLVDPICGTAATGAAVVGEAADVNGEGVEHPWDASEAQAGSSAVAASEGDGASSCWRTTTTETPVTADAPPTVVEESNRTNLISGGQVSDLLVVSTETPQSPPAPTEMDRTSVVPTEATGKDADCRTQLFPVNPTMAGATTPHAELMAQLQCGIDVLTTKMQQMEAEMTSEAVTQILAEAPADLTAVPILSAEAQVTPISSRDGDGVRSSEDLQLPLESPNIIALTVEEGLASERAIVSAVTPVPTDKQLAVQVAAALRQKLGPHAEISGLCKGRRMNPRAVQQVLRAEEAASREYAEGSLFATTQDPQPQSTALLTDVIQSAEDGAFDYEAYAAAHRLETEALRFSHPIHVPFYSLHDRLFTAVTEPQPLLDAHYPAGKENALAALAMPLTATAAEGSASVVDDLMDITKAHFKRKKDAALEAERRRAGPDIRVHPCEDLLYAVSDPSATVLFREYQMKPSVPQALLLPMPLPPTPAVL